MTKKIFSTLSIEWMLALSFFCVALGGSSYLSNVGMGSSHANYYERYATALKQGHLWLQESSTYEGCSWDLSFYKGKCYMYWGILPAFLHLALPGVSDRWIALGMATIAVLFLLLVFQTLADVPAKLKNLNAMPLYLFLVFSTGFPALVLVARVYEEAIVTAFAFGFAGIYFLLPNLMGHGKGDRFSFKTVLGSGCLVLAGLSRAPWFGVAILSGCALLFSWWRFPSRRAAYFLCASLGVIAVGCFTLLLLNYFRFGGLMEFGVAKASSNMRLVASGQPLYSTSNILPNIANYFISGLPPTNNLLSFEKGSGELTFLSFTDFFSKYQRFREFGLGILLIMPSLILGIPLFIRQKQKRSRLALLALLTLPLSISVLEIWGNIYRYQIEANLPLLILTVPPLIGSASEVGGRYVRLHWWALLIGAPIAIVNTLWIVKTICHAWGYC